MPGSTADTGSETASQAEARHGRFDHPFLKRQTQLVTEDGLAVWDVSVGIQKFPYLQDHQVDGAIVFPATGHLELAWAVAGAQYRHEDVLPRKPAIRRRPPDSRQQPASGSMYASRSCPSEGRLSNLQPIGRLAPVEGESAADLPWTRHSTGRINTTHDRFDNRRRRHRRVRGQRIL